MVNTGMRDSGTDPYYAVTLSKPDQRLERDISAGQIRVSTQGVMTAMTNSQAAPVGYLSGSDTHRRSSTEKLVSAMEQKGVLGQQTRFNDIDIVKLTKDKALNRHIHGQMSVEYDAIKQKAQQSSKSMLVAQHRATSMLSKTELA